MTRRIESRAASLQAPRHRQLARSLRTTARNTVLAGSLLLAAGCKDFLDVNENPNGPQVVSANLYLAPMLHWMVTSPQLDARFVGRYAQEWTLPGTVLSTWDRMGYDPSSDNGAQMWRDVYWSFGQNLVNMIDLSEAEERWDLLGIGLILKAWGWQVLTDVHGEIIVQEAIDPSKFLFTYDTQQYAYDEVRLLLDSAIVLLARTDGGVNQAYVARTDRMYGGDRGKWTRFAHGLKAINLNHYSNKATYNPAAVIAAVDLAFVGNADDAMISYTAIGNDDTNVWGRTRNNLTPYRQTEFVVGIMNGSQFGGVVDPRMSRMLAPSPDGLFRGLDIDIVGGGSFTAAQAPTNFYGFAGTGGIGVPGRYLFDDKVRIPVMTYAQLQFVKAEAAYRSGQRPLALTAFRNGVGAHIDFVNSRNSDNGQSPTQITALEKSTFLAAVAAVPTNPALLTMTQLMTQKYIAQWGWGHNEVWMDMRRFRYTDIDPASGVQVFPGFTPPVTLYVDNGGLLVQRIRPRFNSEYVWNRAALEAIGGLALDYHTKPLWITQP